ncbi:MAG: acetyl-CoA carboxylase biotin carboxyl carrier protein subunit [Prolixibacteraceae bacterium]|nr:acetyl-CoA carboxylase biotin carboxyl carrier protein subunit [Prolixibacteraceae bacterium]
MFEKKEMKTLIVQGAIYQTMLTRKFEERVKWETPNKNLIYSFIPGTIIDMYVKTGDKLKEGETILLLEAMKMQNQVRMPFDGVIKKIYVKKDEVIPNRHLMMEIEPRKLR